MIKFSAAVRGITNIEKDLKAESRRQVKAMDTAVRVEGDRLRKQLIDDIRKESPGGEKWAPLSMLQRKRVRRTKALQTLTKAVRYHIPKRSPIEMKIGWVGPQVSKSWQRIAVKHQEGFEYEPTKMQRRILAGVGGRMTKRSKYKPYHFIRKETRTFDIPARPIMVPFWRRQEPAARKNISRNYIAKLKGQRI